MKIFRFAKTKKFRVIVNSVCFYATANQIRFGVGDFSACNAAVQKALDALEYTRSAGGAAEKAACGIAGTWQNMNVQLDIA